MSKSPSLRRIQADVRELALDPSDRYFAAPLENDMFEWHFTIRGADGTDFEGGVYHGRILLPPEYPFKPPNIMFLTPSGRFETNTKICLSFSAFHPELWQPAWGIRLILEALISFLPTPADGAIGALDWSPKERKRLAVNSQSYCCNICGKCIDLLPKLDPEKKRSNSPKFAKEIEELQRLQQMAEVANNKSEKETKSDDKKTEVEAESTDLLPKQKGEEKESSIVETTTGDDSALPQQTPSATRNQPSVVGGGGTQTQEQQVTAPPEVQQQQQQQAVVQPHNANVAGPAPESNQSWLYDPLLNLMIVLLAAICYMLWQKFEALKDELADLRAENLLLE